MRIIPRLNRNPIGKRARYNAQHETAGLPGYPAFDFFGPAGADVYAPATGDIVKLSGHDPANGPVSGPHGPFGWSIYLRAMRDGSTYYMTHFGSRTVHLGDHVKKGQKIGTVGNYSKWTATPNHIHMGVSRVINKTMDLAKYLGLKK